MKNDPVNYPSHYTSHPSGIECITVTRHFNFNLGNVIKYIWRAGEKGNAIEDLQKARWYLTDEIRRLGGDISSSESQRSINDWADRQFGTNCDYFRAFERAKEEMKEFERAVDPQEAIEEAADIVITLYRFASVAGYDLHEQIDRKMHINRMRRWIAHGDGTGHHIKEV